jgi:hypothetical protein
MNRFVKTALAIAVAGSAAHAGTGDNEWAALDSEIKGLASSVQGPQDGMSYAVLLRGVFSYSKDDISAGTPPGDVDTAGFNFNDVDIAFWGSQGPYRWRFSSDIDSNDAGQGGAFLELEDAYIAWDCSDYFRATMGQFKPRVTRSNSVDPEKQVMIDRTTIGSAFDRWDDGVGASGSLEFFDWSASVTDGQNGHEKHHTYILRGEYNVGGGAGEYEGAMGSTDVVNATVGATMFHDDTGDDPSGDGDHDRTSFIFDVNGSVSQFGFGFEMALLDDDAALITDEDYSNIIVGLPLVGDSKPWNVTGSFMVNEEWEIAARYEDLDNDDVFGAAGPDNTVLSVGANWYRGNAGRWQVQWSMFDADDAFADGDVIEVGYAIGTTR